MQAIARAGLGRSATGGCYKTRTLRFVPASLFLLIVATLLAAGPRPYTDPLFPGGLAPVDAQGPRRAGVTPEDCGRCHGETHDQWAASGHARSWSDPRFAASWAHRPQRWCQHCHGPLAQTPDDERAARGVDCATCHLRDGVVLSGRPPSLRARIAHRTRHAPALGDERACAGCHEFNFPERVAPTEPFRYGHEAMQATVSEWRASRAAAEGESCAGCHMPLGDHGVSGAHDLTLIQRTISADVRLDGDAARVTLTATGAAHAVPTGDPWRRLLVELCAGDCSEPVATARFGRRFARTERSWRMFEDTRIPAATEGDDAARTAIVPLPVRPDRWRLVYEVAERRLRDQLAPDDFRHVIAQGTIQPPEDP